MLKSFSLRLLIVTSLSLLSFHTFAADVATGKTLFTNNCATCHNKNMKDKLTGPALGGVEERWGGDTKAIYSWVRNSQGLIASGHPRANELWSQWKPTIMTSFPNLKDDEIASILLYINDVVANANKPKTDAGAQSNANQPATSDNTLFYTVMLLILALLAIFLSRIISSLNRMSQAEDGLAPSRPSTLRDILTSKGVVGFVIFALIVLGGYTTVNNAISLGRQQGYQPEQPIKFSHATHAGLNKIDCQYCHDGARRSKQSVIPAANTCMNCHKAIKKGSQYGTAEISKIYASIGYDPNTDQYIPAYDKMSEKDIETIFKKWIRDNQDTKSDEKVEDEWQGIKTALTNDNKSKIQGPIEWTRIHNLPDHVYFNHSQHVAVGKVACQKCHGAVEKMEVVKQYSPLSMGWCINCHRETEVQFKDNAFYDAYKRYHEELKSGARDKVTVEEIGGLECQKCHY